MAKVKMIHTFRRYEKKYLITAKQATALFEKIGNLQKKFGIAFNFREYSLKEEHYGFVVKNCRSGSMKCNPKNFTDEEIIALLEELS